MSERASATSGFYVSTNLKDICSIASTSLNWLLQYYRYQCVKANTFAMKLSENE